MRLLEQLCPYRNKIQPELIDSKSQKQFDKLFSMKIARRNNEIYRSMEKNEWKQKILGDVDYSKLIMSCNQNSVLRLNTKMSGERMEGMDELVDDPQNSDRSSYDAKSKLKYESERKKIQNKNNKQINKLQVYLNRMGGISNTNNGNKLRLGLQSVKKQKKIGQYYYDEYARNDNSRSSKQQSVNDRSQDNSQTKKINCIDLVRQQSVESINAMKYRHHEFTDNQIEKEREKYEVKRTMNLEYVSLSKNHERQQMLKANRNSKRKIKTQMKNREQNRYKNVQLLEIGDNQQPQKYRQTDLMHQYKKCQTELMEEEEKPRILTIEQLNDEFKSNQTFGNEILIQETLNTEYMQTEYDRKQENPNIFRAINKEFEHLETLRTENLDSQKSLVMQKDESMEQLQQAYNMMSNEDGESKEPKHNVDGYYNRNLQRQQMIHNHNNRRINYRNRNRIELT